MGVQDLEVRVKLSALDGATAPMRNATKAGQGMAAALREASKEQQVLKGQLRDISALRQSTEAQRRAKVEWHEATIKVRALTAEHAKAATVTKAMAREMAQAKGNAARLKQEYFGQGQAAQAMRDKLASAGIATRGLADSEKQLRSELERTTASMAAQGQRMRTLEAQRQAGAKLAAKGAAIGVAGTGTAMAGKSIMGATLGNVNEFKAHEDAMLGIARQVPGARNEMGKLTDVYRQAEKEVRELSEVIPLVTTDIAKMMTASARMEVPREALKEQTKLAAEMAIAFDSAPEEVAESMGKVAKNFKIPLTNIRGLADAINYLDDNAISKGDDIIQFMNRTSGVMSTVAMSDKNAAALGSTLLTLGESRETASTAANAIVQKFAAAEKGTKAFQGAMKELGLSSSQVQKGMQVDAMGTLEQVMAAVKALPSDKRTGVVVDLVGMEHSDTLAKLVDKPEELQRQTKLANSSDASGSMAREFAARADTLSAKQQMLENRMFNLKAAAGETLVPALTDLINAVGPVVSSMSAWVKENPQLAGTLMKVGVGIGVVATGLGTIGAMAGGAMIAMGAIKIGLAAMALAGGVAIAPLLLIGAAIGGVIAAGVMLYQNWEGVKGGAVLLWQDIKTAFSNGVMYLATIPSKMMQMGSDMMDGLVNGIKNKLAAVGEAIKGVADKTVGLFKSTLGINSPSRVFTELGGWVSEGAAAGIAGKAPLVKRAALAMAALPGLATVPAMASPLASLVNPPSISQSVGAASAAAPGGDTYQITIHATAGQDPEAIANLVMDKIKREQGNRARRTIGDT